MTPLLSFCIAIIFVLALLSIITTSVCEAIIYYFRTRATFLLKTINDVLNDGLLNKNYCQLLYDHPQIDLTRKDANSLPAYISSSNFTETLIDVLCRDYENANIKFIIDDEGNTKVKELPAMDQFNTFKAAVRSMNYSDLQILLTGFIKRSANLKELQTNISNWYNQLMDRATGWFKIKIQRWLFFVSLAVTIALNANFFVIVENLWTNNQLTQNVAVMAQDYVAQNPNASAVTDSLAQKTAQQTLTILESTNLPFGWRQCPIKANAGFEHTWYGTAIGWIVMGVLLTFGAPFWFQLLSKLVNIRKAGVRPD
ncbi:MAG TPA: hypothetical protein VN721_10965 [Flavipsychrobacter sp.]|nr:hypothetical protein [Flavipsychrobacter sp.]